MFSTLTQAAQPFTLGALAGVALLGFSTPAQAQTATFTDVGDNYWARPFIENLAAQGIIAGFPDGTFKPDQAVTRAQFAAIVRNAFDQPLNRSSPRFSDVPANYWGANAIANAYGQGFMSGYPGNVFQPEQQIPRVQALVALANGLTFSPNGSVNEVLGVFRDANQIPDYGRSPVAAATERRMVVNYPNVDSLRPVATATRADIAAFVYQAMVAQGRMPAIQAGMSANNYIVGNGTSNPGTPVVVSGVVPRGTRLAVRYPGNNDIDIVVAPGQTVATSFQTTQPVLNAQGQTLIPAGSTVQGQIVPVNIVGAQVTAAKFVADSIMVNNRNYALSAESSAVAATNNVSNNDLQGAVITSAAQSILTSITGNNTLGSIVGSILTGTSGTTTSNNTVVVIRPSALDITTQADLRVNN
ncbi:hypothetical protein GFS31_25010 [Leptolyngbya sp. BL0902]|nr:hypothetical protein GFS31_25010 [Leptolyngbya sp. BL0902]